MIRADLHRLDGRVDGGIGRQENDEDVGVVLLTAYATVESAVEAMKIGAYHFANKPFDLDDVSRLVEKALETTRLRRELRMSNRSRNRS